jgi:pyruvate formate lyase activating enzyme
MRKALFYLKADPAARSVRCVLCPHECVITLGNTGICGARQNYEGDLYSLTYDEVTGMNMDPVEKKPLYHFYPGSRILSVGSYGCNLRCGFCQNWEISQAKSGSVATRTVPSQVALDLAQERQSLGIAYTYNEPLINYEWVKDTAKLFRKKDKKNVLVTNGYLQRKPLEELLPLIDAVNVDVKAFGEGFYHAQCGGGLSTVRANVELMVASGIHVEITALLIPGHNDAVSELEALVDWVAALNPDIPLHFSRYFPRYKMQVPATGMDALVQAYRLAARKLHYVYIGNVDDKAYNRTTCPHCSASLIERDGYDVDASGLNGSICKSCSGRVAVIV